MAAPRVNLESLTGRPEADARNIQRALDRMAASGSISYSPANAAHWNSDPPSTVAEALDRLAAMLGPIV
jgi:hypothetical protein